MRDGDDAAGMRSVTPSRSPFLMEQRKASLIAEKLVVRNLTLVGN
jgi:hypothetical protein